MMGRDSCASFNTDSTPRSSSKITLRIKRPIRFLQQIRSSTISGQTYNYQNYVLNCGGDQKKYQKRLSRSEPQDQGRMLNTETLTQKRRY